MIGIMGRVDHFAGFYIVANIHDFKAGTPNSIVKAVIRTETCGEDNAVTGEQLRFPVMFDFYAGVEYLYELGAGSDLDTGMRNKISQVLVVGYKVVGELQNIIHDFDDSDLFPDLTQMNAQFTADFTAADDDHSLTNGLLSQKNGYSKGNVRFVGPRYRDAHGIGTGCYNDKIRRVVDDILQGYLVVEMNINGKRVDLTNQIIHLFANILLEARRPGCFHNAAHRALLLPKGDLKSALCSGFSGFHTGRPCAEA